MRKILKGLNELVGIRGSMVVSHDGMVIAACLGKPLDEDKVAAMASNVVMNIRRTLESHGGMSFDRMTLVSSHGKMMFTDTGIAYLVVVMDRNISLGPTSLEIQSAAMRISSTGRISIT